MSRAEATAIIASPAATAEAKRKALRTICRADSQQARDLEIIRQWQEERRAA